LFSREKHEHTHTRTLQARDGENDTRTI